MKKEFFISNEWERDQQDTIWYVNAVTNQVFTEDDFKRFQSMRLGEISVLDDYEYTVTVAYGYKDDDSDELVAVENKKIFAYVEYLCLKNAGITMPSLLGDIDTDTGDKVLVYMHPWIRGKFNIDIDGFHVSSSSLKDLMYYWESLYNLCRLSVPTFSERFML